MSTRRTTHLTAGLAIIAALALSEGASAATYCVNAAGCQGIQTGGDLQKALDLAQATPKIADAVRVGAGVYKSPTGFHYEAGDPRNALTVTGKAGETTLRMTSDTAQTFEPVLDVDGTTPHDTTVRGLDILRPAPVNGGTSPRGLVLRRAAAERVSVKSLPGSTSNGVGAVVMTSAARLRFADITAPGNQGDGIRVEGRRVSIEDVSVKGAGNSIFFEHRSSGHVSRARVDARTSQAGIVCNGCRNLEVDGTSIWLSGSARGLAVSGTTKPGRLEASHVTIVGQLPNTATGVSVKSLGEARATAEVDGCVIHTVKTPLATAGGTAPPHLSVQKCNYANGGQNQNTSTLETYDNTSNSPGFVDYIGGDFRLTHSSGLLDLQGIGLLDSPWTLDLMRRYVDGDGDGSDGADLGAYEYQALAPVATIAGPVTATAGKTFKLDGSASHGGDPGESVVRKWTLPGGKTVFATVVDVTLPAGKHVVKLDVTDPTGKAAEKTHTIQVAPAAG